MASFHGLWSLGGLAGASLGAAFAASGSTPLQHFAPVSAVLALLGLAATRGLAGDRPDGGATPALVRPSRRALAVGLLASCGAVIEGGIAEWGGVYLKESLGARASVAATGFAAFSLTMMVGRFTGDRLIDRFGRVRLLKVGSALTGAAIAAALLSGDARAALLAFGLAGLGMSTVFPIAFSVAGMLGGAAPGQAIAAVATMAYGAGLAGPPLIGFLAAATSLPVALSVLVAAAAAIAAFAGRAVGGRGTWA
jgi:fucose permease